MRGEWQDREEKEEEEGADKGMKKTFYSICHLTTATLSNLEVKTQNRYVLQDHVWRCAISIGCHTCIVAVFVFISTGGKKASEIQVILILRWKQLGAFAETKTTGLFFPPGNVSQWLLQHAHKLQRHWYQINRRHILALFSRLMAPTVYFWPTYK